MTERIKRVHELRNVLMDRNNLNKLEKMFYRQSSLYTDSITHPKHGDVFIIDVIGIHFLPGLDVKIDKIKFVQKMKW